MRHELRVWLAAVFMLAAFVPATVGPALAAPIHNPIAVFAGLDKITGKITTFEVPINETRRFGSLNVRPRVCDTRPDTEPPKTIAFVEVDDNEVDGSLKRIFTGWMLAESPGLNAVEHPVYDVWLTGCRNPAAPPSNQGAAPRADSSQDTAPQAGN